ncbi:tetratricopeptide repeat protein [Candidatus Gracilibacteria bacterium]|nr:tetratricopeptide repeat protein [Candidatus Gracilibacteria bacterium]
MDKFFINKKLLEELKFVDEKLAQDFDFNLPNVQKQLVDSLLRDGNLTDSYTDVRVDEAIKNLGLTQADFVEYMKAISLYQIKKDYSKALEIFQYLQQKYPNIPSFLYYQGIIYMEFEMFDDAIFCFQDMLDIQPQNYQAMMGIANSLMLSGYYDEAIIHYQNISGIYPDSIEPIIFNGVTENLRGNYINALNIFEKIKVIKPTENISNYQGYTYFLLGEYDKAIYHYDKYLKSDIKDYQSFYMLGKIYNKKKNFIKSKFYLESALEISQSKGDFSIIPDVLFEFGLTYSGFGEYQEAISYFDGVLDIDPQDIDAYIQKSECLFKLGDISGAKNILKNAIFQIGENDQLLDTLSKMQDA